MSSAASVTYPWPTSPDGKPTVIGHRGDLSDAAENTMGSFRLAAAHQAAMVETDIQISADGVPFLLHDDTLTRTTNAAAVLGDQTEPVAETQTWADLSRLDAGSWLGADHAGERVPHLDDLAALHNEPRPGSPALGFDLEIKPPLTHPASHVIQVVNTHLRSAAWSKAVAAEQVAVTSFDPEVVELAVATLPVPVGLLLATAPDPLDLPDLAEAGISAIVVEHSGLTEAVMVAASQAGLAVWVYTANERSDWDRLIALGVGGICTDHPGALRSYLESMSAPADSVE